MSNESHDQTLRAAFDGQAAKFEKAPLQSNPELLRDLAAVLAMPAGSRVLDVGCGPGLVSAELLRSGYRVVGVDLSPEMIAKAEARCAEVGGAFEFRVGSVFDASIDELGPFDAVISRLVLHHVPKPWAFVERQAALLRPGGVLVLSDHTTDPDPSARRWHQEIEVDRDKSHANNLTPGEIVDLFARAGLRDIRHVERPFRLDFDEWFDRGTPRAPKFVVRAKALSGESARGWDPIEGDDGAIAIDCWWSTVRGVKPGAPLDV